MGPGTCRKVAIWPEIGTYGARLTCCLPANHSGDCACADIEYLPAPAESA